MSCFIGWDIGGANIKAACVVPDRAGPDRVRVCARPFEIWREKDRLPEVMRRIYSGIVSDETPRAAAITMTAELSDVFATKREGVLFVLNSIRSSFPEIPWHVLDLSGNFVPLADALERPLDSAATNWLASALWFAPQYPDCLLVDVGSTTTDILPILGGKVCVSGRTDMDRLSSGELVFTGALRTNLAAIVSTVPVAGRICRVASEYFAISGDVHLILGHISAADYDCSAPDGRSPSVDTARGRLARLVCADVEMLAAAEVDEMARYVFAQQVHQVSDGIRQVLSRLPQIRKCPVLVFGTGAFLGRAAAMDLGLELLDPARHGAPAELAVTPCVAAAHLLAAKIRNSRT